MMILRRVIEHFRKQEWTAIAIDFVIVVLGVFIGIQVANWNAATADRRIAEKYLADIALDVQNDVAELSLTRERALSRISAAAYMLRIAGDDRVSAEYSINFTTTAAGDAAPGSMSLDVPEPDAPPPEMRNRLWPLLTRLYYYDATRSAYEALIGSGKIDLIDDPRVMRALREYYYLVNGLSEMQDRSIQPGARLLVEAGIGHGLSPSGAIAEADLAALIKEDPTFAATIAAAREYAAIHILLCDLVEAKAKELLQLLAERNE